MGVTQGAGLSLRWFRDQFGAGEDDGRDPYERLAEEAAAAPPGSDGPTRSGCSETWPQRSRIRTDGDEGLFASYSDVQFLAPVRAGDVLEVTAEVVRVGTRSRTIDFTATVVARGRPDRSASAAEVLAEPVVATTATGVVVVPKRS